MEIIYLDKAIKDIDFWKQSQYKSIQNKITQLILSIQKNPYRGVGKPEPLKYELSGKWSRRINQKDRIIYSVDEQKNIVIIYSLRGHYM